MGGKAGRDCLLSIPAQERIKHSLATNCKTRMRMRKSPDNRKLSRSAIARRERILVTALNLIRGPSGVSVQMRDVAEKADVALGTLYRYFPSRQELLAYAYERWREECLDTMNSSNAMRGTTNVE